MFRFLRTIPKLSFGRFDINTTEQQKITKAILANSDNCGDIICGDPKIVKNIIKYGEKGVNGNTTKGGALVNGNPELCCEFYGFSKCKDCNM